MNAGTPLSDYVHAKVGIFFQINGKISKKNGDFTETLKNFTYFCTVNADGNCLRCAIFDILTQIRGACPREGQAEIIPFEPANVIVERKI